MLASKRFRKMLLIRRFEEACIDAAQKQQVPGHFHVYIGQEATGVGVMSVLDKGDFVHSTHRNHGHLLARGADPKKALAEILGKATGYAGGKAGTLAWLRPRPQFSAELGHRRRHSADLHRHRLCIQAPAASPM